MYKPQYGKQDFSPFANGIYFITIIRKTPLHNENSEDSITEMGVANTFENRIKVSTLNIDFIQCHTHLNVCAVKWITHDLIHDFHFTFQAYTLPHTLNGICVAYLDFILEF